MSRPVILVHGIWDSSKTMSHLATSLKKAGKDVYSIDLYPSSGRVSIKVLAKQLKDFIDDNGFDNVDIVSFSMGDIVSKYYLLHLEGYKKVSHYVSISTPHKGTLAGFFLPFIVGKELRPQSLLMKELEDTSILHGVKCLSIWTPYDLMIIPAKSSVISFGENIKARALLHPLMLKDKKVISDVIHFIANSSI